MTDPDHRHRCEVRYALRMGRIRAQSYRDMVGKKRGLDAARALWADVLAQAKRGNCGAAGDWR